MKDAPKLGRKPTLSETGERLGRINIKLYPSQIAWLKANGGSGTVREMIDKRRAGRMLRCVR